MILEQSSANWKLINYRVIDDLISAEFLHDLYNRHIPEINSIRFRNTVCIYQGTRFSSYAPEEEWKMVREVLGYRFYVLDSNLINGIRKYIKRPKEELLNLLNNLDDYDKSNQVGLIYKLMDLHYTSLGQIYGINLVQIEQALEYGIGKYLKDRYNVEKCDLILSGLLNPKEYTTAVKLEIDALELSIKVTEKLIDEDEAEKTYDKKYGNIKNGYGTINDDDTNKIKKLCAMDIKTRKEKVASLKNKSGNNSTEILDTIKTDTNLKVLLGLAEDIGTLRDSNKALMGRVSAKRNELLELIAKGSNITRKDISRYSLNDLYKLVNENKKLSKDDLNERWNFVSFVRKEQFMVGQASKQMYTDILKKDKYNKSKAVNGVCASAGTIVGRVRIINKSDDCKNISSKDIIVVKGTDFDMMDGLLQCGGIITEEGGILSHASVLARELKKPCLINVVNATELFFDNQLIKLDASNGSIELIEDLPYCKSIQKVIELKDADDNKVVGNKAANLNKCYKLGFNVLDGVVFPFDVKEIDLSLTRDILNIFMSQYKYTGTLIVRSSSTIEDTENNSMAGVFMSDISDFNEYDLLDSLKRVRNSNNSKIVTDYVDEKNGLSIIIQPYLTQDYGGVAFSINPINLNKDEMVIEYSKGGSHYVTEGKKSKIIKVNKNKAESQNYGNEMSDNIKNLIRTVLSIEEKFKFPVDIEWGMKNNKLYILQVRPIVLKKEIYK